MATYVRNIEKSRQIGPVPNDSLLTNREAAEFLRVSERQWYRLRKYAGLEPVLIGRNPRFWKSDIEAALVAGRYTDPNAIQSPLARVCASVTTSGSGGKGSR